MQDFSGFDSFFLLMGSPNAPMQCGGVCFFDISKSDESFDFNTFKEFMASRQHLSKIFRQRLVEIPLNLGRPYWIEDPNFNLDFHLRHMTLPKPGGRKELSQLAGEYFSQVLPRTRPLWEAVFIEGLDGFEDLPVGSFGVFVKVHHAAIDGVSAAKVAGSLLNPMSEPQSIPESDSWEQEPIPTKTDLLLQLASRGISTPFKLAKLLPRALLSAVNAGLVWELEHIKPPPSPFTAPPTRFNVPLSNKRVFDGTVVSLETVKKIKNAMGVTVNDVVLAICAGGLKRYLEEKDELPEESIVALTPISVREEQEGDETGNQISGMLISLATDEDDLVKRLRIIHENTIASKTYHQAVGVNIVPDMLQSIPFSVASLITNFYMQMKIAKLHTPVFNLVISNVAGPREPLYMNGARMVANFPVGAICDGMGLFVGVLSYAGTMEIGVLSCREVMPDVDVFVDHIKESLNELEASVAKHSRKDSKRKQGRGPKKPKAKTTVKAKPAKKAPAGKAAIKKTTKMSASDTVLTIIKRSRKGVDAATLMRKTGFTNQKVRDALYRLKKQGKIKNVERGLYVKA